MVLDKIQKENDIKNLSAEELQELPQEIRNFLIEKVSKTGGHLASNLGTVELTMALHLSLDLPKDKIIWDVGHQSYTHKLLTGRKEGFETLRKYKGMSGFPKRKESDCDAFDTGHSSTSISAGLGYVKARDIKGEEYTVVAVIGDGSLTGGLAYEALNNASSLDTNYIIILNDNNMSISRNVGGMSNYLNGVRTAKAYTGLKRGVEDSLMKLPGAGEFLVNQVKMAKNALKQLVVPGMLFEDMGITYLGPVDGHDVKKLMKVIHEAKRIQGAVLIHVLTEKGQGYEPAMQDPSVFHGIGPFNAKTGEKKDGKVSDTYTDIFSKVIYDLGKKNPDLVTITAAMADGTGLTPFSKRFPERFFDVGIAEEHALTFAAGLAAGGMKPVVALYSSFLQRAFDQVIHDICMQKLPVVLCIDRAGLVGSDGETHQGQYDISFLSLVPNMTVMSPKNRWEMADMIRFAVGFDGPVAVRYPRGTAFEGLSEFRQEIQYGKAEWIYHEKDIAILFAGHISEVAVEVYEDLKEKGYSCSLVNARFMKPIDQETIKELSKNHKIIITIEEGVLSGGFGEQVQCFVQNEKLHIKVMNIGLPDQFVEHGSIAQLRRETGLDKDSIVEKILAEYKEL